MKGKGKEINLWPMSQGNAHYQSYKIPPSVVCKMSDSEEPKRKRTKSGQERTAEWRKQNPELNQLAKEKEKLAILKKEEAGSPGSPC